MTESGDIRVGDTEREAAMTALGEHMGAGRLDVEEYGERSARVAAAKTRGELIAVFTDLPDPRPVFGGQQAVRQAPQYGQPVPAPDPSHPKPGEPWGWTTELAQQWEQRPLAQRLVAGAVPLSAILAVILFVTVVHTWWIFMLPAAAAVISGAILGENRHDVHEHRRQIRDSVRDSRRAYRNHMRGYYQHRHNHRHDHRDH